MHFTAETSSNVVIEREFTIDEVPGVLRPPQPAPRAGLLCCWSRRRHAQEVAGNGQAAQGTAQVQADSAVRFFLRHLRRPGVR
jgi:hypothetical protein